MIKRCCVFYCFIAVICSNIIETHYNSQCDVICVQICTCKPIHCYIQPFSCFSICGTSIYMREKKSNNLHVALPYNILYGLSEISDNSIASAICSNVQLSLVLQYSVYTCTSVRASLRSFLFARQQIGIRLLLISVETNKQWSSYQYCLMVHML